MKERRLSKVLSILMVVILLFGTTAQMSSAATDEITVKIDGKKLDFDVSPIIKNGRTLVPMRKIFEELGADVTWYQKEQAIVAIRGNEIITMMIGSDYFMKGTNNENGVKYPLDVSPEIVNGRTLVPARAVAEALDCTVEWDQASKTVNINSKRNVENKVLRGVFTNKDVSIYNVSSSTKVYPNACGAYIYGGTVYYSLVYQPVIYAYDGTKTVEYKINDSASPSGIVVKDDTLYYFADFLMVDKIESIDLKTSESKTWISTSDRIKDFFIYNDFMYVLLRKPDITLGASFEVLKLNLETDKRYTLYDGKTELNGMTVIDGKLHVVEKSGCIQIYDCETNEKTYINPKSAKGRVENVFCLGEDLYIKELILNGFSVVGNRILKWDAVNNDWEEVNESEKYKPRIGLGYSCGGYTYYMNIYGEVIKKNESNDSKAYLRNSSNQIVKNLIAMDGNIAVYWDGEIEKKLSASADKYSGALYSTYYRTTKGYTNADIYIMTIDSKDYKKINSYKASTETTSSTGNTGTQICSKCNGTKMQTCHLCGGSGLGPSYVQAYTHQTIRLSCAPCGGTGKYPCSQCSSLN